MDWPSVWYGSRLSHRLTRAALWPLSGVYALGWRAYLGWYAVGLKRRCRAELPVIGIGSLLVGGTGKTPVTVAVAHLLAQAGRHPAVSASGYGGDGEFRALEPGDRARPEEVGDEAAMLRDALPSCPVLVGRRRVQAARAAAARPDTDVLVLDDGFQHLPLDRSLDILVAEAGRPFGNGLCLPAGPLREPRRCVRRASALLLLGSGPVASPPGIPVFRASRKPTGLRSLDGAEARDLASLAGVRVVALSALGNPSHFEGGLAELGAEVARRRFPDHHAYAREDLSGLQGRMVVTTPKDAVKLRDLAEGLDVWVVAEEVTFDDPVGFRDFLLAAL
jgi:tetraacyldisaccharide 4'-kinase